MKNKTLALVLFLILAAFQLYVPISMIGTSETVLEKGTKYKFRTAPLDPNDPFRGKYVQLGFQDNMFKYPANIEWDYRESVYVTFTEDSAGFAIIQNVSLDFPSDREDYLKTNLESIFQGDTSNLWVDYPFDIFYMEEFKAPVAETKYRESFGNPDQQAYAEVFIWKGRAVINDLKVNDFSIKDLIEQGN